MPSCSNAGRNSSTPGFSQARTKVQDPRTWRCDPGAMATVRTQTLIDAHPDVVWDALRDFGALHERLAPGFVTDCRLDGPDRIVTFFNGVTLKELFIDCDDGARRLAW